MNLNEHFKFVVFEIDLLLTVCCGKINSTASTSPSDTNQTLIFPYTFITGKSISPGRKGDCHRGIILLNFLELVKGLMSIKRWPNLFGTIQCVDNGLSIIDIKMKT